MQTNTRILAREFEYFEPKSLAEALALLDRYQTRIKVLGGGTDILVKMKLGRFDCDYLLNIMGIESLNFVDATEGLKIGAATRLSAIEASSDIKTGYRALHDAVKSMAATAIRNMATIGGNLCNAAPAADTVPALLAFGAILRLQRSSGERRVPVGQFLTGPEKTVLQPGEILTAIEMPAVPEGTVSTFIKLGRVSVDMARINLALVAQVDHFSRRIYNARLALGAVGPKAFRCPSVEALLEGRRADDALVEQFAQALSSEIERSIPGRHSLPYKKEAVKELASQSLANIFQTTNNSHA
jgi:carbon-monoxide dehydrogenase medium subunit